MPDRDTTEQALDALVYGPVGFALYVRDTAPSFLKLFVARGVDLGEFGNGGHLPQQSRPIKAALLKRAV